MIAGGALELEFERKYKIRLSSGRVLGPIGLDIIARLVLRSQINGREMARDYPIGEWKDINQIPEIAEMLIAKIQGKLIQVRVVNGAPAETQILEQLQVEPEKTKILTVVLPPVEEVVLKTVTPSQTVTPSKTVFDNERTELIQGVEELTESQIATIERKISEEKTILFQREAIPERSSSDRKRSIPGRRRLGVSDWIRVILLSAGLFYFGNEYFGDVPQSKDMEVIRPDLVRPELPIEEKVSDPVKSEKYFKQGVLSYNQDTISGYRKAVDLLQEAVRFDANNIRALAVLASSYLNLIDASNKDERFFLVINQLIALSKAKNVDLVESVIADVEYSLAIGRAEAAQVRIDAYSRKYSDFPKKMYFYISQAFFARGDSHRAARFLTGYDESPVFSPKVYFLRSEVAEALGDLEASAGELVQGIKSFPGHSKSYLRLAELMLKKGKIRETGPLVGFILKPEKILALSSKDTARAYWMQSTVQQLDSRFDEALFSIERAVKLDPEVPDYLLELYSLRAKMGDNIGSVKRDARMYLAMSEGEKLSKEGKYTEAIAKIMDSRDSNSKSHLPWVKLGDLFLKLRDVNNARANYAIAAEKAPESLSVWSKYIQSLILSYEFERAEAGISRFRQLNGNKSILDRLTGDVYSKQGRFEEAKVYYRQAMSRSQIDHGVYASFARALFETGNYKDSTLFYSLGLRFDPTQTELIIGSAKAVAASESVDRAIVILQDELKRTPSVKAEILTAIAELQIQKGEWALAQQYLDQAMNADPDFPYSWKVQGDVHSNRLTYDKDATRKALEAYQAYSDRNQSDPSGYISRYRIFVKQRSFTAAAQELTKVFALFPKYPMLNYYQGALFGVLGDHQKAIEHLKREISNNPRSIDSLVMLGREMMSECEKTREPCNPTGAIAELNKAISIVPGIAAPRIWAGYGYFLLKNYSAAIALYRSALSLDPGNPLIHRKLADALRESGNTSEARKFYKSYLEADPEASDKAQVRSFL
jgi:tetratricopeptide (TPR) repeat protein